MMPTRPSILLIEDHVGDAELVGAYLELQRALLDARLVHVVDLRSACALLAQQPFTVALLDLGLPDSQGARGVKTLLDLQPELILIVLTGLKHDQQAAEAMRLGAQDYLVKQELSPSALERSLRYALERGRLSAQLRTLVERNADAILVVGPEDRVLYANPRAHALLARPDELLLGQALGFPLVERQELTLTTASADPFDVELRLSEVRWDGQPARLVTLRDLSDRKRAQSLERRLMHADRLASVGQLAAGVAHEVNNPATFVLTNLLIAKQETLARAALPPDPDPSADAHHDLIQQLLSESIEGMERIVQIVRGLKAFSKIAHDEVELVDLNEVVEAACTMTSNEVRHRATLIKRLTSPLPKLVAHRGKLIQVVVNLLLNAAQALSERDEDRGAPGAAGAWQPAQILISTQRDGDHLLISVEDNAAGIPAALMAMIFEPFFTTKARDVGTGLGLSLSRDIMLSHGGQIRCESTPGQGARFDLVLPLKTPLTLPQPASAATPQPTPWERPAMRVLVIDDDLMVLRALNRMLQRGGYEVTTALGGQDGLMILERGERFDAILCDLMMPQLDGPALYALLQARDPALAARMIFCSGGAFTPRAMDFVAQSGVPCLDKPLQLDALARVLAELDAPQAQAKP